MKNLKNCFVFQDESSFSAYVINVKTVKHAAMFASICYFFNCFFIFNKYLNKILFYCANKKKLFL